MPSFRLAVASHSSFDPKLKLNQCFEVGACPPDFVDSASEVFNYTDTDPLLPDFQLGANVTGPAPQIPFFLLCSIRKVFILWSLVMLHPIVTVKYHAT